MRIEADLHNHGPLVPGDYRGPATTSNDDIVRAALDAGLDVFALTDHFSVDNFRDLALAADRVAEEEGRRLLVLPGMEMRLAHDGEEVHLVVILPPEGYRLAADALLAAVGFDAACAEGGLHRVILSYDPVDAARAAAGLGAIVSVAHADRWFGDRRLLGTGHLDRVLFHAPIAAVELLDPASEVQLGRHAGTLPVVHSSDSHSNAEVGRRRTVLEVDAVSFEGVREALAAHRVVRELG